MNSTQNKGVKTNIKKGRFFSIKVADCGCVLVTPIIEKGRLMLQIEGPEGTTVISKRLTSPQSAG